MFDCNIFLFKMFSVRMELADGMVFNRNVNHIIGYSSLVDSFHPDDLTVSINPIFSGPPEYYSAFFLDELKASSYGDELQILANIVQSCDFLGLCDDYLRPALEDLVAALQNSTSNETVNLLGPLLPDKILEWHGFEALLLFATTTTLYGPLKLGTKENKFLDDAKLAILSRNFDIEELDVDDNPRVTTVKPCAATLKKLIASRRCGINDAGLSDAKWIEELDVWGNDKVTTVNPHAKSLEVLSAGWHCGIDDTGLKNAHLIRKLNVNGNMLITSIAPFANTLTHLKADWCSGLNDNSLAVAKSLKEVIAWNNINITLRIPARRPPPA